MSLYDWKNLKLLLRTLRLIVINKLLISHSRLVTESLSGGNVMKKLLFGAVLAVLGSVTTANAATVWTNWTSGTVGPVGGSASGTLGSVGVSYSGEMECLN